MGSTVFPVASASAPTPKTITYTSGTTVFTAPTNCSSIFLFMCGGGGGGGGATGDTTSGGGGGGGGLFMRNVSVTPGQSYNVVIGAGGAAGSTVSAGSTGGSSSFGSLVTVLGGGGGMGLHSNGTKYVPSSGGANSGGTATTVGNTNAGGGAGVMQGYISMAFSTRTDSPNNTTDNYTPRPTGSVGFLGTSGNSQSGASIGGKGWFGFCGGGGGGAAYVGNGIPGQDGGGGGGSSRYTGTGYLPTAGTVNTGGGGGGAADTGAAGAGGSGYAEITYWS